jgi:hypothetical protein
MIHRGTPRVQTLKLAKLFLYGATEPISACHVVEVSEGGARVVAGIRFDVPEFLILRFNDGGERHVRRCWTKKKEIGLEFIPAPPSI